MIAHLSPEFWWARYTGKKNIWKSILKYCIEWKIQDFFYNELDMILETVYFIGHSFCNFGSIHKTQLSVSWWNLRALYAFAGKLACCKHCTEQSPAWSRGESKEEGFFLPKANLSVHFSADNVAIIFLISSGTFLIHCHTIWKRSNFKRWFLQLIP